eukprot:TRINITY_DN6091_c3_g1_i2.p1 TRINITY_DN6091_c3_g1~~TRINITY_DN6091_c3_g1_i2.p1  ORF type:complete len:548 (+),score=177.78 TRINITY_DN6091_c3_g1_i2:69-1646(+)
MQTYMFQPQRPAAPPPPSADPYARGFSSSPVGATTTTAAFVPGSPPSGAHFSHHFEQVARALEGAGVHNSHPIFSQGLGGMGSPLASPRAPEQWGPPGYPQHYLQQPQPYSKTITVAAQSGAQEHFRIAVGEAAENIRETLRGAFGLSPGATFCLRDSQGCNAVLGFPSLVDGARYELRVTSQQQQQPAPPRNQQPQQSQPAAAPVRPSAAPATPAASVAGPAAPPPAAVPPPPSEQPAPPASAAAPAAGPRHGVHSASNPIPGAKKALLVGVNYSGQREELSTSLSSLRHMQSCLTDLGFNGQQWLLTDDNPRAMPTKENILRGLTWLSDGVRPGESVVLYFCGHGAEFRDDDVDDAGAFEEAILPTDFKNKDQGGYRIVRSDDVLHGLIARLPPGCRCTIVCDCCHSGALAQLGFRIAAQRSGELRAAELDGGQQTRFPAEVIMFSAAKDGNTSPDLPCGGALTAAWTAALRRDNHPTYESLLAALRAELCERVGDRGPLPLLSSTHRVAPQQRFFLGVDGAQ